MADIDSKLPVIDAADGTDGASAPTVVQQVGGIDGSNNLQSISVDTTGKLNLNPFIDRSGTGTITALNGAVTANTNGMSTVQFNVTGTWVATIAIEVSHDGSTWTSGYGVVYVLDLVVSGFSGNGLISIPCGGFSQVRLRASAFTSGTVSIAWNVGSGSLFSNSISVNAASFLASAYLKDGAGTSITSTLINSKQRLDVNSASNGIDGSAVPFQVQYIGGIDGSGNLQGLAVSTTGVLMESSKVALTGSAPTSATIGTSSATVIASNANRKGLVLTNTSTLAILSLNIAAGTATNNTGIILYPRESWEMDEYTFTTAQINAISTLAGTVVSIQELIT